MKRIIRGIWIVLRNIYLKARYPKFHIGIFSRTSPIFFNNLDKKLTEIQIGGAILRGDIRINNGTKFFGKVECTGDVCIGRYTSISGPNTVIYSMINKIEIGSFCSIAPGVRIQEYYHDYNKPTSYYINRHILKEKESEDIISKGAIIIEDDVWIGANSIILSSVKIGRGSVIAAGSIVTKNVDPYSVVAGNPAKLVKKRFSNDTISKLEEMKWWEWSVEKIKEEKVFFQTKLT